MFLFTFLGTILCKFGNNVFHSAHKIVWCTIPSTLNKILYVEEVSLLIKCFSRITKHIDKLKCEGMTHFNIPKTSYLELI